MTPFHTRSPTTFSGSNNSRYREQILQRLLSSLATWYKICTTCYHLVLDTRLELVRCCHRQILSLLCLPIPPIQQIKAMFYYGYVPRPKNITFWLFRIVRTSFCLVWYFSPLYPTALLFNRPVSYFNVFAWPCQFWTLATCSVRQRAKTEHWTY